MGIGGFRSRRSCTGVHSGGRGQFAAVLGLMNVVGGCLPLVLGKLSRGGTRLASQCCCSAVSRATTLLPVLGSSSSLSALWLLCISRWVRVVYLGVFL